jgi:hypothetical protein
MKLETVARTGHTHMRKNESLHPEDTVDIPVYNIIQEYERFVDHGLGKTSFLRQYYTLVMRDITVAIRDPALYYLQFILVLFFGFLVGAVFMNTKYVIDNNLSSKSGGLLWVVFMMAYMQIFKVTQYLMMSSGVALYCTALHCIELHWIGYVMIWSVIICYDVSLFMWIHVESYYHVMYYVTSCHILHNI